MKKFLIKLSYTVLPVWLFFVGLVIYLSTMEENPGDLMRLALVPGGPEYTDSVAAAIPDKVYYKAENNDSALLASQARVVVIGDSFSHGGGVGKRGDYVNYLSRDCGGQVVLYTPLDPSTSSPMQNAYDLLVHAGADSTCMRNLVVEEVERYLVERHSSFTTQGVAKPRPAIRPDRLAAGTGRKDSSPLLRAKDYIFYRLFGANPIYEAQLSQPMFGGIDPDHLYFYNEDVINGINVDAAARQRVVDCFDKVMAAARERGVNVVFVIAADKYDLYQDYIVDNPYPSKTLNEDLERWMARDIDHFVITKRVLHPLLEQGVKDVYLYNDTHWSPASSQLVAAEVIKLLK